MKKIYYLLFSCLILSACSSDDNGPAVKYLFSKYLVDEISIKDYEYDETDGSFELGWVFDSPEGGKVTELGGLFPEAGSYTVTLWDADTEAILGQAVVEATAGKRVMKKIETVIIEAEKSYVVSYNSYQDKNYYWLSPDVEIYPLELNGITVRGEVETGVESAVPVFPGTGLNSTVVGVPEIGFIKN